MRRARLANPHRDDRRRVKRFGAKRQSLRPVLGYSCWDAWPNSHFFCVYGIGRISVHDQARMTSFRKPHTAKQNRLGAKSNFPELNTFRAVFLARFLTFRIFRHTEMSAWHLGWHEKKLSVSGKHAQSDRKFNFVPNRPTIWFRDSESSVLRQLVALAIDNCSWSSLASIAIEEKFSRIAPLPSHALHLSEIGSCIGWGFPYNSFRTKFRGLSSAGRAHGWQP